ncbi:hypothetical protein AX16_001190 [Volvariella volvacea WC 439]|nr:hypothetical protein AX16_001190 [Volvariella volvacea WC 439]
MGQMLSGIRQSWPSASKFNMNDIPVLTGKVTIVMGGNTYVYPIYQLHTFLIRVDDYCNGIGKETVKALLTHNAKVYLAARSTEKASQAINNLLLETVKEAVFLKLDLSNLKSIKRAAEEFQSKEKELHILFNSAGVMFPPIEEITTDGYDLQFGTNVLGKDTFAWYCSIGMLMLSYNLQVITISLNTKLLLPTLLSTAKNTPEESVRVVTTASLAHELTKKIDFNTFKDGPARKKKGSQGLYVQSKFGNVVQALELARRYSDQGIVSISLNPGNIRTDLQRHVSSVYQTIMILFFLHPPPMGALTQLYGGTSPEGANLNGKYLIPWARVYPALPPTQDPETGKQLWNWLEEQVEMFERKQ